MKTSRTACLLLLCSTSLLACRRRAPVEEEAPPIAAMLADTGFRPSQHGFGFQNHGGQYPKTPPVLTAGGIAALFGKDACLGGDASHCKLTPAAAEWMALVNRKMNGGQCEGMAVASLAFFKKVNDPGAYATGASSAHDLTHDAVGPLIGYYWAFQLVNPVRMADMKSALTQTPSEVEDTLVELMKRGELATLGIRSSHGGHAVTPYAVEDRGNQIHWIRIYDNNWPDKERYIVIDRQKNSWTYELASINPDVPKVPWSGNAESHSISVIPLSTRLGRGECSFCAGGTRKVVVPHGANSISLTNHEGKRLGFDGDKLVNEIPDAEVVHLNTYLDGAPSSDPVFVVPADGDYEIAISGHARAAGPHADDDHGVAVIGNGSAVAVETARLKPGERDTLSLHREGGVKYRSGTGGTIPPIRLAHDGGGSGMHTRIANMKAEPNGELEVKVDHRAGHVSVQGGGKASSYDLSVKHVHAGADDHEVAQKGIKLEAGKSHTIHTDPRPGARPAPLTIKSAPHVAGAKPAKEKEPARPPVAHPPRPAGSKTHGRP